MFYHHCSATKSKVYFLSKSWAATTVRSFLNFSLYLWNDRCDSIYNVDEEVAKRIQKKRAVERVRELYENMEDLIQKPNLLSSIVYNFILLRNTLHLSSYI